MSHGTIYAYNHGRCRCDDCHGAWAAYHRAYRKRRRDARIARARVREYRCDAEIAARVAESYATHDAWGNPRSVDS